jgi:hypothetical protein
MTDPRFTPGIFNLKRDNQTKLITPQKSFLSSGKHLTIKSYVINAAFKLITNQNKSSYKKIYFYLGADLCV